jgi:Ca-activated chloride channel family protein
MNREQAEKLLAALVFDDLDESSKAELLAYLQTDDDLRDRLADMRMAVKLTCDAVNEGPDPILAEHRLKKLRQLAGVRGSGVRISLRRSILAAAAVLVVGVVLIALLIPSLNKVHRYQASRAVAGVDDAKVSANKIPTLGTNVADKEVATLYNSDELKRIRSSVRNDREGGTAGMGGVGGYAGGTPSGASYGGGMGGGMRMRGAAGGPTASRGYADADGEPPTNGVSVLSALAAEPSEQPPSGTPVTGGTWAVAGDAYRGVPLTILDEKVAQLEQENRRGTGQIVSYEFSGAVTPSEPPVTMTAPAQAQSAPTADAKGDKDTDTQESARKERLDSTPSVAVKQDQLVFPDRQQAVAVQDDLELNTSLESLESRFKVVPVNPWVMTERDAQSTFALDVDTASYTLCRRYIHSRFLPPIGAVRMEEFINAFDYAYPQRDDATFAVHAAGSPSPFAPAGQDLTLLKIAVKARTVGRDQRRAAHIVFVVDASASMGQPDRLPSVQSALNLLVDKLDDADRISLVTCADEARLHLEAVPAKEKETIHRTIDAIQSTGRTNLLAGLKVGYDLARRAFVAGRINQVVLCSDGVANVGRTEADEVLAEVAEDRKQGITLTCVGVGYGAYNDAFLEAMADRGDGRYVFLDSSDDAREALVGQLAATLQTVARDARIQVQFNPARVRRYRLIGYENRDIEDRRFRDDTVDAGEVGSGQCSTALYEMELINSTVDEGDIDLGIVFVRYRNSETGQIEEISRPLTNSLIRRRTVEEDPRFFLAAGAARFAEWLRQSEHAKDTSLKSIQDVLDRVSGALPLDQSVRDLAVLAHQAENLPRATQTPTQP